MYSDQLISATELNRQPSRVLDLACDRAHNYTIPFTFIDKSAA
ncbi:MAG TPA: hypothetical protein V6C95_03755 [Coleofasciculaceae cyanobacterium]